MQIIDINVIGLTYVMNDLLIAYSDIRIVGLDEIPECIVLLNDYTGICACRSCLSLADIQDSVSRKDDHHNAYKYEEKEPYRFHNSISAALHSIHLIFLYMYCLKRQMKHLFVAILVL